jgi:hypothetical protein
MLPEVRYRNAHPGRSHQLPHLRATVQGKRHLATKLPAVHGHTNLFVRLRLRRDQSASSLSPETSFASPRTVPLEVERATIRRLGTIRKPFGLCQVGGKLLPTSAQSR